MENANRQRERGALAASGGLTENDLINLKQKGEITQRQIDHLDPFFEELKKVIHEKWEALLLSDGEGSKLLKFQLIAVKELQRLMKSTVTHGKQAAKKLEVNNG